MATKAPHIKKGFQLRYGGKIAANVAVFFFKRRVDYGGWALKIKNRKVSYIYIYM